MALFPWGKGLFLQFSLGNEAHLASDRLQRLASPVPCHTTYTEILVKLWRLPVRAKFWRHQKAHPTHTSHRKSRNCNLRQIFDLQCEENPEITRLEKLLAALLKLKKSYRARCYP